MKFDVVIGNPPYNKGIASVTGKTNTRGYPHLMFIDVVKKLLVDNGIISFVIPASFMTLASLTKYRHELISTMSIDKIHVLNNSKQKYFDISKFDNVAVLTISNRSHAGETAITREDIDYNTETTAVDLCSREFWPLATSDIAMSILDKVLARKCATSNYKKATPFYVSFAVMGDGISHNHTKRWLLNEMSLTVKCPVQIFFNTEQDATLHYEFYKTKLFNMVYGMCKSTPKNQPQFVAYIGEHNFASADFYAHFGLTREEIDYVESTVK